MKRIIASVLLAVIIFALSLYGRWVTNDSISLIQNTMNEIDTALANGNTETALLKSEEFLQVWDKHHGRMCLFLQHEHLDPLENIFALLPYYIKQNEIIIARAECCTVRTATEHILKTERISLENIL